MYWKKNVDQGCVELQKMWAVSWRWNLGHVCYFGTAVVARSRQYSFQCYVNLCVSGCGLTRCSNNNNWDHFGVICVLAPSSQAWFLTYFLLLVMRLEKVSVPLLDWETIRRWKMMSLSVSCWFSRPWKYLKPEKVVKFRLALLPVMWAKLDPLGSFCIEHPWWGREK